MHVIKHGGLPQIMDTVEFDTSGIEGLLVFMATLVGIRTNLCAYLLLNINVIYIYSFKNPDYFLGTDEDYDYCQSKLEMVTLLCVSDKTHSQLMELMPERCGGGVQTTTISTASTSINDGDNDIDTGPKDFETILKTVSLKS